MPPLPRLFRVALLVWIALGSACAPAPGPSGPIALPVGTGAVRLFVEPDDGVGPVVGFIGAARRTLDVAMYLLSDREVVGALEAAPRRGVRVRVMLEEHPYGTGPGNDAVAGQLKGAGVAVGWSPASFQLSHDKYAVSDGKSALVGSPNWTHSAFTSNREYLAVDDDPTDVGALADLFAADWQRQQFSVSDPNLVVSPVNARADLKALIDQAGSNLDLEAEELQDPGIEDALAGAARRGVAVRVILPLQTQGPDANSIGRERVTAGGVKVRRLRDPYVHAKDVVVDGKAAFVGSENLSTPSLDDNREVGLLISDSSTVRRLEETFGKDWDAGRP